jgi:hypothetical protein
MSKFLPTIILASCALGLGLTAGSLATASYSPDTETLEASYDIEPAEMIPPVASDMLFDGQLAGSCMNQNEVMHQIAVDQMQIGGEAIKLSADRYQGFADAWRAQTGTQAVMVSGVVGHVYFDETAGDWMVDVTEFDPAGCAQSRTIISAKQWNYLIKTSTTA